MHVCVTMNGLSAAALVAMNRVVMLAYLSAMVNKSAGCSSTVVLVSSGSGVGKKLNKKNRMFVNEVKRVSSEEVRAL